MKKASKTTPAPSAEDGAVAAPEVTLAAEPPQLATDLPAELAYALTQLQLTPADLWPGPGPAYRITLNHVSLITAAGAKLVVPLN